MFIFWVGCRGNENFKLSSLMTSENCYWDVSDSLAISLGRPAYCYKFNKNGQCLYFFYDKKGKRNEYYDDDVVVPKQWEIKGDTVLILGIRRCLVIYSQDTILLENPITKGKESLIRNCR
jgi:hypothetical protein